MEIYVTLLIYFFMKTKCKFLVEEIKIYLPKIPCSQEWLCNKVEMRKDFRLYYFWLYFVQQNF